MILELPTQKSGKYKAVSGANLGSQGVMNLTQCDYVRSINSASVPIDIRGEGTLFMCLFKKPWHRI